MKPVNRIGLIVVFIAMAVILTNTFGAAEQLQCWPAHTPTGPAPVRAPVEPDPNNVIWGIVAVIGAIAMMW